MTARSATKERTFEVYVRIDGLQRMLHFDARDSRSATNKAQQAGYKVLSVQKADEAIAGNKRFMGEWLGSVIGIQLPPEKPHSALALDEIAFRRARRIENNLKYDKNRY